jgi:hypothetical protein
VVRKDPDQPRNQKVPAIGSLPISPSRTSRSTVQTRSDFIENALILFVCFRALAGEQDWSRRLWDAQLADISFVVETGHADTKRCHWDLSIRRGRRAEKIDRADNFLQLALQVGFPDLDRVVHCIFRENDHSVVRAIRSYAPKI